jgi:hypothetical protein
MPLEKERFGPVDLHVEVLARGFAGRLHDRRLLPPAAVVAKVCPA